MTTTIIKDDETLFFDDCAVKYFCDLLKVRQAMAITSRELQCMCLWLTGHPTKRIGQFLSLSHRTVETHINNLKIRNKIFSKDDAINRLEKAKQYHNIIFYAEFLRQQFKSKNISF